MKLSVIIVNYNVRAYLEQCLRTVFEALKDIEGDVFVVDNQSTDGSVEMVREKFPRVKLIANAENVGFSRANNQAIRASEAEYVVLLNPDTVVGEEVFRKVLAFLDSHPKAGGLGVKMIDGTGTFLPESKRGLPTPAVAFYKIIGLTRMFPHSRMFGRYHLGHLPENEAAPIEILSGACMFLRTKTLAEVGLLDESFFMYGEDIDLSYRITLGGYENWYFPDARIIHYKGESTKKSSVNYVFVFYNAMAIFAQKHFTRRSTDFFSLLINGSIYLSATAAIVARFLRRALLPIIDLLLILVMTVFGSSRLVSGMDTADPLQLGIFATVVVALLALTGAYDRPVRLLNVVKGMFLALLVALVLRAFTGMLEGMWNDVLLLALLSIAPLSARLVMHALRVKGYSLRDRERQRILAIGSAEEAKHALALLWQTHFGLGRQKQMDAVQANASDAVQQIRKKVRKHGIDEIVFCAKDLAWGRIIELMEELRRSGAMFKIAQPAREFIIGPSSIESISDLHIMEQHAVHSAAGRRTKRILDVVLAVVILFSLPLSIWWIDEKGRFLNNWWQVMIGMKSWVGYHSRYEGTLKLPVIKRGVLDPLIHMGPADDLVISRVNITYAKDYRAWDDLVLVVRGFRWLGRA